jgi:uncharacterized membrane protein YraQ (UPF0718 family)
MMQESLNLKKLNSSFLKSLNALKNSSPILIAIILALAMADTLNLHSHITSFLSKTDPISAPLLGAIIGSISAGNPATSYVLGGELLNRGASVYVISAFLISWVTVGFIQFPAEAVLLSKRFALARNMTAFIFSILIALLTGILMGVFA